MAKTKKSSTKSADELTPLSENLPEKAKKKRKRGRPKKRGRPRKRKTAKKKGVPIDKPKSLRNYDIIRKGIADYCKSKYGRNCTRKESSEIYQTLKLRFLNADLNTKIPVEQLQKVIDEKLANRGDSEVPFVSADPFEYYRVIEILYGNDGGFYQETDTLFFDLRVIGEGIVKTSFADLPYTYKEDMYGRIREFIVESEAQGIKVSPQPQFVFDADKSNIEKREFWWKLNFDGVEGASELFTGAELKKQAQERESAERVSEDIIDKRISESIKESEGVTPELEESRLKVREKEVELALEREKQKTEKEKQKTAAAETKLRLVKMLEEGKITFEQYQELIKG
jgi:hypothetical protein